MSLSGVGKETERKLGTNLMGFSLSRFFGFALSSWQGTGKEPLEFAFPVTWKMSRNSFFLWKFGKEERRRAGKEDCC